jgi:hypothetical protein
MSTPMTKLQTQLAAELAELDKKIAPPSGHRISLKAKQFTFPDLTTSPGPINAVILDWRNVNTFYKGAYNPAKVEAPVCFALAKNIPDLAPSPNCSDPQNKSCEDCHWNQWNSAPGGGNAKACKNQIRIAIVPPDAKVDTPPWTIDLAPSSIAAFNNLVNTIRDQLGKLPLQVQVTIDFDPNADYPKLTFADPKPLPEELIEMMFDLRKASQSSLEKEPGT